MTISRKTLTKSSISTLLNLSSSRRSFMLLSNPEMLHKDEWYFHLHVYGYSLVYFSLYTPDVPSDVFAQYAINADCVEVTA